MLKYLRCIACKSSTNLVISLDFKTGLGEAICIKRYTKPSLVRKYRKVITNNGCGHKFKIKSELKQTKAEISNGR